MSKQHTGEEMINRPIQIDGPTEKDRDPLPWLIHNLREKQAGPGSAQNTTAPNEPAKDAS